MGRRLLTRYGRWMAAVLACGPGAVLSHLAAAALWGMPGRHPDRGHVPRGRKAAPRDHTFIGPTSPPTRSPVHHGIPTTTVPRTLLRPQCRRSARRVAQRVSAGRAARLERPRLGSAGSSSVIHGNRACPSSKPSLKRFSAASASSEASWRSASRTSSSLLVFQDHSPTSASRAWRSTAPGRSSAS